MLILLCRPKDWYENYLVEKLWLDGWSVEGFKHLASGFGEFVFDVSFEVFVVLGLVVGVLVEVLEYWVELRWEGILEVANILSESHVDAFIGSAEFFKSFSCVSINFRELFLVLLLIVFDCKQGLIIIDGPIDVDSGPIRVEAWAIKAIEIGLLLGFEVAVVAYY